MTLQIDATYSNGVLKLDAPLPLGDQERVRVTVETAKSRATRAYGLLKWTGDPEELREIAINREYGIEESP